VVEPHHVAESTHDPRETYSSFVHRFDRGTRRDVEVDAPMDVRPTAEKTQAESGSDRCVDRPSREVTSSQHEQREDG
jgi:hypothetical protein